MYKNQLQEFAQRSCINLPAYSCIREGPDHAPRFKAKVNCNGEIFESPKFCCTLRQAEHAAAEVALKMLSRRGPSRALAAKVLDETGVYKNLLQETAHRAGLKLPVYTNVRAGPGYAPVFTCTVELAGMSFSGEPAKTKKQAQKSAAMAAWFALKKVAQECSSSSISDLSEKDELEQVIVARCLSSLMLPETRKSEQRELGNSLKGFFPAEGNVIPYGVGRPAYRVEDRRSNYSYFSPERIMYGTFHQGIPAHQSHFLPIPSASTPITRPSLFPFIQSILRPDIDSILWAGEREPVALVPEIGPFVYLSNNFLALPYRNDSRVTIEEIEENRPVQEDWLNKDVKSPCWRDNVLSNVSSLDASNNPQHCGSSSSLGVQLLQQETGHEKGLSTNDMMKSVQTTQQNKEFSWISPGFICNRPNVAEAQERRQRPLNINSWRPLQSNVQQLQPNVVNSPRHSRDLARFPTVSHATGRNPVPFPSSCFRPEVSNRFAPVSTRWGNAAATRPSLEDKKHFRPMACASQMAPAVQIRSVMPVCSSFVRGMPSPSQERTSSQHESQRK